MVNDNGFRLGVFCGDLWGGRKAETTAPRQRIRQAARRLSCPRSSGFRIYGVQWRRRDLCNEAAPGEVSCADGSKRRPKNIFGIGEHPWRISIDFLSETIQTFFWNDSKTVCMKVYVRKVSNSQKWIYLGPHASIPSAVPRYRARSSKKRTITRGCPWNSTKAPLLCVYVCIIEKIHCRDWKLCSPFIGGLTINHYAFWICSNCSNLRHICQNLACCLFSGIRLYPWHSRLQCDPLEHQAVLLQCQWRSFERAAALQRDFFPQSWNDCGWGVWNVMNPKSFQSAGLGLKSVMKQWQSRRW